MHENSDSPFIFEEILEEKKEGLLSPNLNETSSEREQYFSSSSWEKRKTAPEEQQNYDILKGFHILIHVIIKNKKLSIIAQAMDR